MNNVEVKIKPLAPRYLPSYKHDGDACADCYARLENDIYIGPKETAKIPLGFCLDMTEGYRAMIYPRSGLATKQLIAATGVIDSNYRGELCCSLANYSNTAFVVKDGDRVCQIAIEHSLKANFIITEELSDSDRGENGFGSTGV